MRQRKSKSISEVVACKVRAHHQNMLARSLLWSSKLRKKEVQQIRRRGGHCMLQAAVNTKLTKQATLGKREICLCGFCIFHIKKSAWKHALIQGKTWTKQQLQELNKEMSINDQLLIIETSGTGQGRWDAGGTTLEVVEVPRPQAAGDAPGLRPTQPWVRCNQKRGSAEDNPWGKKRT